MGTYSVLHRPDGTFSVRQGFVSCVCAPGGAYLSGSYLLWAQWHETRASRRPTNWSQMCAKIVRS